MRLDAISTCLLDTPVPDFILSVYYQSFIFFLPMIKKLVFLLYSRFPFQFYLPNIIIVSCWISISCNLRKCGISLFKRKCLNTLYFLPPKRILHISVKGNLSLLFKRKHLNQNKLMFYLCVCTCVCANAHLFWWWSKINSKFWHVSLFRIKIRILH